MNKSESSKISSPNIDKETVESFGKEWSRYDQSKLSDEESSELFDKYFAIMPVKDLPPNSTGFDMGCGSGRWAKHMAPYVGKLNCIDASSHALQVARINLSCCENVVFHHGTVDQVDIQEESQDFGYSLGVLHHIPDTLLAMKSCVKLLKPDAPFLVYLYYRFDNRPSWFRMLWKVSDVLRGLISRCPEWLKHTITDFIAVTVYWPLARTAWLLGRLGFNCENFPLAFYSNQSFYTMRTDSRDRFGTPLEQRFTRVEIKTMMEESGLHDIHFSESEPYWCVVGRKKI